MSRLSLSLSAMLLLIAPLAHAGDDDDDLDKILNGDDPEPEPAPAPSGPGDDLGPKDPDTEPAPAPNPQPVDPSLLEDEELAPVQGADTAEQYRQAQEKVKTMSPEDEEGFWESYLAQYPNTQFRVRIQERIDELMAGMYNTRINTGTTGGDAADQEIHIAQGLLLEPLNPRSRLSAGLEWGNPDWINLFADYEAKVIRTLSFHGGIHHRYAGWSLETGTRWAFVKSTRTQTVVSLIGDFRLNTEPAFPALVPQLAAGKKFGKLDVQLQGGADLELRSGVQVLALGGANLTYRATDTLGVFLESQAIAKNLVPGSDLLAVPSAYRFQTITVGLKFYPMEGDKRDKADVNLAGTAPYAQQYWQYHFGAIMAQGNYYTD